MCVKNNRAHRLVGLSLALSLAFAMAACGAQGESASRSIITAAPPQSVAVGAPSQSDTTSQPAPVFNDENLTLQTVATALSGGVSGNNNGCYTLRDMGDGSTNILYFDYAALQLRTLENPPQAPARSRGHITAPQTQLTPVVAGEHLFLFRTAAGEQPATITRLNADGTGLLEYTLPENTTFQTSSALLWDGAAFLLLLLDTAGDTPVHTLARIDFQTLQTTTLTRFESGFDYSIEGHWEKGPILCQAVALPPANDAAFAEAWDNRDFHLYNYAPATGESQTLLRWKQGQPVQTQADRVFYWDAESDALNVLFANTLESGPVASGFAPEGYSYVSMQRSFYSGLVILQFSNASGSTVSSYAVSPATGNVFQPPLPSRNNDINIVAESDTHFLVRTGERWANRATADPDYDPENPTGTDYNAHFLSVPEYALITRDDYWAGTLTLAPIEDLVY